MHDDKLFYCITI